MDPAKKKWLRSLIEQISNNYEINQQGNARFLDKNISGRDFIYKLMHLTGLVFGYPAGSVYKEHPLSGEWNETDKAKVFFTESLLACYLHYHKSEIAIPFTADNLSALLTRAVESIATFYSHYKPTKDRPHWIELPRIFRSDSSTMSKVEQIIDYRLKPAGIIDTRYWNTSQYNIFIFLDIIFYREWLINPESMLYQQESIIQCEIIKTIAVSIAYTTNRNQNVERHFFQFFLENTIDKTRLKTFVNNGKRMLPISTITTNPHWPAIINQILFEYSIFTFVLDGTIDEKENDFINQIAAYFNIDSEKKELCLLVVSSFFYSHLREIPYLKSRHKFDIISSNLSKRLSSILLKNRGKISREIQESKELARLLWKAKNTQLTDEEREKVKHQLTDIFLRTVPSLAIFMVPGGTILLPILLKILPEEVLMPSSFRNK
ncbi:hypothetical protein KKI24_18755 [bacterium]|nr:hypothetical protein [bacterium]